jgi:short-subunit dehydrogenase
MHGVSAFSDALRQELAGTGINVLVVHPALTATRLLAEADPMQMPAPFRHMTPLSSAYVGDSVGASASSRYIPHLSVRRLDEHQQLSARFNMPR